MQTITEFLLRSQYPSESPLFQHLYHRRNDGYQMTVDENKYFQYLTTTFQIEVSTTLTLIPSTFISYKLLQEIKKPTKDVAAISRYTKLALIVGLPAIHMFLYSQYRRMISTPPYQKDLEEKYFNELRPKLKLVDSSNVDVNSKAN